MLVLLYTYKCTSECDICTFACSPERKEKLEKSVAKRLIEEAKENDIRLVGFAGGEPLLFKDEIIELAGYCSSLGIASTITSNCFWGETYEKALGVVKEMKEAGVNHLKISSDDFHSKVVPYENIKNVLIAAKKMKLKVVIGCTSLKNSGRLPGMLKNIQDYSLGVNILEQTCYPVGRAAEKFDRDDFLYNLSFTDICRDQGTITIDPDGKAYPCGCMCGMIESRELGSIFKMNLCDIIKKAKENKHVEYISQHGIDNYIEYIRENNLPIKIPQKVVDTCHMCYELFGKKENMPYLDVVIQKIKAID